MPEIDIIDHNHARATWAMYDNVRFSEGLISEMTGYGYYHETYQRFGGPWKISSLKVTRLRLEMIRRGVSAR